MNIGKKVVNKRYIHSDYLRNIDFHREVELAVEITNTTPGIDFTVVKISDDHNQVSLLDYPGFYTEGFPILKRYWTINIANGNYSYRTYENSQNPPILHRKELLIPKDHKLHKEFKALTESAEQIGLFEDTRNIGFLRAWEELLKSKNYKVVGQQLLPIGNEESFNQAEASLQVTTIERHRTALSRTDFSAPLQALGKHGFLDGDRTVFDYGCGKGDDLRGLLENNIKASGWDPYYAPTNPITNAKIVNLGFVINVIECIDERIDAIKNAFELADELIVISAMLANIESIRGTRYADGVLTSRNTFQKYYSQTELKMFICETINIDPIPVAPGIFFAFKDKESEQRFLMSRLENRRRQIRLPRLIKTQKQERIPNIQKKYFENKDVLDNLWETFVTLGRLPEKSEFPGYEEIIDAVGSVKYAIKILHHEKPETEEIVTQSRNSRIDDLKVFFAIQYFEKKKPYKHLDRRIQRDVKEFFYDYESALAAGKNTLFEINNAASINESCRYASENGIGWWEDSESLHIHTSHIQRLPAILRTYIACGSFIYGDVSECDLIKIHIRSGKLTLMYFDDFNGKALPRMTKRVKINLRTQDFHLFEYTDQFQPQYLYKKSRYINEEHHEFLKQISFENEIDSLVLIDYSGHGPSPDEFDDILMRHRIIINGYEISRKSELPNLDSLCGKYFSYRDFIECGETQARTRIENRPKNPDTYSALLDLALNIIDPVIDYYGMVELTYGFCSQELSGHIKSKVAPKLDQHAAHECNRVGKPICDRLGAAVDFIVRYEDMFEVAQWIVKNLKFDRLYFYGSDRPIHVSYGMEKTGQVTIMNRSSSTNKYVPKSMNANSFLEYKK